MRRPAYFFLTIVSLSLAICSWSLAQEEIQNDSSISSTGQELTQVDTGEELASAMASSGDVIHSLSGDFTSISDQSGFIPDLILSDTGTVPATGIFDETGIILPIVGLPHLIISEVFFDGSDERLELSNVGSGNFSGQIHLTGVGINTTLFISLLTGQSVVVGKLGRTFTYILDQSVIGYYASMSFTDTKAIEVHLYSSGQLLDDFLVDTGTVNHYNDKHVSLEKRDGGVTGVTLERSLNVISGYLANPGSHTISFLYLPPGPDFTGSNDLSGSLSGLCQNLSSSPALTIEEIFWGNSERDFYIEILAHQDFTGNEIILSGSFLSGSVEVSLAPFSGIIEEGRRFIISLGSTWDNEQIFVVDNHRLAPSESGGFLQILSSSGQSGQVMDIVAIGTKIVGSSSYYAGNMQQCARNFTKRGRFSPGFDEVFLKYIAGTTSYKIICDAPVATSTISSTGSQSTGNDATGSGTQVAPETIIPEYMWRSVRIDSIDYDPAGSDTNNEKITFIAPQLSGAIDLSSGRYLMIGTRKRYLRGTISNTNALTLQASFAFPNSIKNGLPNVIQLWNKESLVDSYSYFPEEEKKELTGENILSGDLLTGEEFLSGGEAKILWIIPNPKGSDAHEQISLIVKSVEGRVQSGGSFLMTGFSFLINGKTKKIKDSIPLNQETILSGSFSFPNKAACVSLVFGKTTLDTLCYPQPKEGETIYADGKKDFVLDSAEQSVISSVALKKIGNTMCAFYGNLQIDCNSIPSGKTAFKTKNENKLYESFINILQPYLQKNWGNVFYQTSVYQYFSLLRAAKKNISAGLGDVQTSHGVVPVYDLSAQLHVIETFSPGYRAKRFGQVLLNEI